MSPLIVEKKLDVFRKIRRKYSTLGAVALIWAFCGFTKGWRTVAPRARGHRE